MEYGPAVRVPEIGCAASGIRLYLMGTGSPQTVNLVKQLREMGV